MKNDKPLLKCVFKNGATGLVQAKTSAADMKEMLRTKTLGLGNLGGLVDWHPDDLTEDDFIWPQP
jgi:hypothetical protein